MAEVRVYSVLLQSAAALSTRVQPALGRWFTDQEGVPGNPPPVVLSHGLWIRRYGRDPAIVGRSLTIDGLPTTVVGVMPASFTFPDARTEAWIAAQSTRATASDLFTVMGVARLRDGTTLASARAEMTQLMTDLSRVSPNHRGWIATAMPLMILIVIAASVALMLGVIGIYGVMSYVVSQRTGEIGVRLALGADPGHVAAMIVRQGGLVAIAGVIVGLGLAYAGSQLIASLLYGVSARDPVVFAATTMLLLTVALLSCWLPARRGARLSPLEALRTE